MLRFVIVSVLLTTALAYNGYGARKGYQSQPSYAAPAPKAPAYEEPSYAAPAAPQYEQKQQSQLPVFQSQRKIQYKDVASTYQKQAPLNVEVPPAISPVNLKMDTRSSPLEISSYHHADGGSYKETSSEDAPHVRVHTVTRPVYQKTKEIISPYRTVEQQIQPVQETSEAIVAKEQGYAKPAYAPAPKQTYAPKPAYPSLAKPAPKQTYAPKPAPVQTSYAPKPKQQYAAPARRYANTY